MKTNFRIKGLIALLSITFFCSFSIAAAPSYYDAVIQDYIESQITSNYKKLNNVLDNNCVQIIPRGNSLIEENKNDLVEFMKTNAIIQRDCSSSYQILAKSNSLVIAVVDLNYQAYTQENFLTIEKNKKQEWKITRISKIFTNEKPADAVIVLNDTINTDITMP
ncbi:MAG: hypothetical protein AAGC65_02670 [Mucilaginibacter sp.]|uniref:hypothetical protein n=1 Tax=Mucilaginibacter sp. TaxID=1882438 RepID=UPI0031A188A3